MTTPIGRVRGRYAVKPGGRPIAPSVTTVIGAMVAKPALAWGAAKETALFAIHHQAEWAHLRPEEAYERLRKHHRGVWDDKAARGTQVHDLACQWAGGLTVDVPADCDPYMDALERFYVDHRPEWLEVERSVIYDVAGSEYGGSFDAIARLHAGPMAGESVLLDYKTGRRYPVEVILQLAAYRGAKKIGVYDGDGNLADTRPMLATSAAAVCYLHDDGTYELLALPANGDAHATFLRLRVAWGWMQEAERWVKAHPEQRMGLEVPA